MSKVENVETCKEVLTLLENLANGWRQPLEMKKTLLPSWNFFPIIRAIQGQWVAKSCLDG